jgi:hypothetical protein
MDERAHEVAGHLGGAIRCRPDRVEDPAGIVEFTKVDEGADLDAGPLLGSGEIALR